MEATHPAPAHAAPAHAETVPDRFYEFIRGLLPLVPGLTGEARAEYAAAVTRHEDEHAGLVAKVKPVPDKKTTGDERA
jgi:hypothetical protein